MPGYYFNPKKSIIVFVIVTVAVALIIPSPVFAQATGREIIFSVRGDNFTYLKIVGDNQNDVLTSKTYGDGTLPMVVRITTGYWWKGTVVLTFKTVKNGLRQCVIDYLDQPANSTTVAVTYTEGVGCTGEAGSSISVRKREVEVLYKVLFSEEDSLQVVKLTDGVLTPLECVNGIVEGIASPSIAGKALKTIKITSACGGIAIGTLNDILKKHNVKAEYYLPPGVYLGFSGNKLYLANPRIFGDEVKMVQRRLLELGYSEIGSVDGYFGPLTEKAVQRFQSDKKLPVTGVVDGQTWESLFIGKLQSSTPRLASPQETARMICDTCNFTMLEDRAKESYNTMDFGKNYGYTVKLTGNEPLVWMGGWCAKDQVMLDNNLKNMTFQFWINGKSIPKNYFSTVRTGDLNQGYSCETYRTAFLSWIKGVTIVEYRWTINADINDGFSSFKKGDSMYVYYIVINP